MANVLQWRVGENMGLSAKYKQITKHPAKNKTYVGYCHSNQHKGFITVDVLKYHQCVCKPIVDENGNTVTRVCPSLEKLEHLYWKNQDNAKIARRINKAANKLNIPKHKINELLKKYNYNE